MTGVCGLLWGYRRALKKRPGREWSWPRAYCAEKPKPRPLWEAWLFFIGGNWRTACRIDDDPLDYLDSRGVAVPCDWLRRLAPPPIQDRLGCCDTRRRRLSRRHNLHEGLDGGLGVLAGEVSDYRNGLRSATWVARLARGERARSSFPA